MKRHPYDNPFTAGLRLFMTVLFWLALYRHWGWGWALIAVLLILGTGVKGDKQLVFADVPGTVRVVIELVFALAGLWTIFAAFGFWWGLLALVVFLFYAVLSTKRFRYLMKGHS